MSKTYAVLGGGGSFGIHTALYLLENASPRKVLGIGRSPLRSRPFSLDVEENVNFQYHSRHITYEFDLLLELLDREKPEVIINFAAQGEGAASWKNSWRFFETNAMALSRLTEELQKRNWLERFIHIGTSEMYGSVNLPVKEDAPIQPSSPYAASKVAFDLHLLSIFKHSGFPMNIIRPSNAYCPGQLLHRVIPRTVWCGLTGNKLPLQGGGLARKSYIHARDLASAILMVSENGQMGEIYNVGPEFSTPIREVVERAIKAMNLNFEDVCEITDDRLGQDSQYWLDSSKIKTQLGWEMKVFWDEGLTEMVDWGRRFYDAIKKYPVEYVMRA